MKFIYRARTKDGEIKTGNIEAPSKEIALSILQTYGYFVTYLEPERKPFKERAIESFYKLFGPDMAIFTRQLAIMLKSSIPVSESLETLAKQQRRSGFRSKILEIAETIEAGSRFSEALSLHPDIFPPFYVGMVSAGEASGNIPESLDYLANYLERQRAFKNKIVAALFYPVFVLILAFGIMLIMGIFVVPKFAEVFKESGVPLPFITKAVISAGLFLNKNWPVVVLGSLLLVASVIMVLRLKKTKRFINDLLLKIPLIKDFIKEIYLARIALTLSTLIAGGLPIIQALEIAHKIIDNEQYQEALLRTKNKIGEGKKITEVFNEQANFFLPLFLEMLEVGEKTGHIEKTLFNVFEFYNGEIERKLNILPTALELFFILFLGGVVLLVALAIFVPLSQRMLLFGGM